MASQLAYSAAPVAEPGDPESVLVRVARAFLTLSTQGLKPPDKLADAWARLSKICRALFRQQARNMHLHRADRDDCEQEALRAVLTQLPRFHYDQARGSLRDWLGTLVHRAIVRSARRVRHDDRARALTVAEEWCLPGRESDPAEAYERIRLRALVQEALEQLRARVSERSYQVLLQHDLEERTVEEVAGSLDLTPKQVRDRLDRTRLKLRALLERRSVPGRNDAGRW